MFYPPGTSAGRVEYNLIYLIRVGWSVFELAGCILIIGQIITRVRAYYKVIQ